MPEDIRCVYRYFRRKGFDRRMSRAIALHCCDPTQPMHPEPQ